MSNYKQRKKKLRQLVKEQQQQRIKKIQEQGYQYQHTDQFKKHQKLYKYYKHRNTDYSKLLKLQKLQNLQKLQKNQSKENKQHQHQKQQQQQHQDANQNNQTPIHKIIQGYHVFQLKRPKGAYIIKNFCNQQQQIEIGMQALNQYIYRPYRTNLDGTNGLYNQDYQYQKQVEVQPIYKEKSFQNKETLQENLYMQNISVKKEDKALNVNNENINKKTIHQEQLLIQKQKNSLQEQKQALYYFNQKIRMANLGYQYDWPHRSYPSTKVPIPLAISQLTKRAHQLFNKINQKQNDYKCQAIIVNYYKEKDYMTGHLDDGQENQISPIFSFCFGLSCVFLIGGPTRQQQPVGVKLDSGDLMIMSGYSRICYHGVPRIIQDSYLVPQENSINALRQILQLKNNGVMNQKIQKKKNINGVKEVINYFKTHRLNFNVRQVYNYNENKDHENQNQKSQKKLQKTEK